MLHVKIFPMDLFDDKAIFSGHFWIIKCIFQESIVDLDLLNDECAFQAFFFRSAFKAEMAATDPNRILAVTWMGGMPE